MAWPMIYFTTLTTAALHVLDDMQTLRVLKPCQDHDENIDLVDAKNSFIISSTTNIISDKILESLASGNNSKDTVR